MQWIQQMASRCLGVAVVADILIEVILGHAVECILMRLVWLLLGFSAGLFVLVIMAKAVQQAPEKPK